MYNNYEVLTPEGWADFSGLRVKEINELIKITTNHNKVLRCSLNHPILTVDGFKEVQHLSKGATISTADGFEVITKIELFKKKTKVYDLLNVEKGSSYFTNGIVSHNCVSFLGSSGTLISGAKLKELFTEVETPIHYNAGFGYKVYKEPKERRTYTIIVDVSRGKGQDYSAFQVLDTTEAPYEQVAIFRNNMITPTDYARFIFQTAKGYNDAYVLVELNDIGGQVADLLALDYEYENVIYTSGAGASGKRVTFGYGDSVDRGIRTTKTVKGLGCSMLKLLIEQDKIRLYDADTIQELAVFSQKGQSYEAEEGYHDDTVMCLVLFAWLTTDDFFKNMNDENVLHSLRELTDKQIEETLVPFGVVHSGVEDTIVEEWGGERWELESGVFDSTDSFGGW